MSTLLQIQGTVPLTAQITSTQNRDAILNACKGVTQVNSQETLETAVVAMKDLAGIIKETEGARKATKAPVLALGKEIDAVADKFVSPVEKESSRINTLVTSFRTLQLKEENERKAKALAEQAQAEAAARKAEQDRIAAEKALAEASNAQQRAEAEKLRMQAALAAESAELRTEAAQETLSIPTNTPKGMVTKVRWDVEIKDPFMSFGNNGGVMRKWWLWNAEEEKLRFDRLGFLKALNGGQLDSYIPKDGYSATFEMLGIVIFRDTRVSFRA